MTAGAADVRRLARMLAELGEDELAALLAARDVPPDAPWRTMFDAADALLAPTAVDQALARLPLPALLAAHRDRLDPADAAVLEAGGLSVDGGMFDTVRERLEVASDRLDRAASALAPAPPPTETEVAAAAERALLGVASLTELLLRADEAPLPATATGAVTAAGRRGLARAGIAGDPDATDDLIALGAGAGLWRLGPAGWAPAEAAGDWLDAAAAERWTIVARAFLVGLPEGVRESTRPRPAAQWPDAYPLDPQWPQQASARLRQAQRWGILTGGGALPPWSRDLGSPDPDLTALAERLPPETEHLYLQADLTGISPGPLHPSVERRLRAMSDREGGTHAGGYRFTERSLSRAFAAGETAASVRAFLAAVSLTGIPQPLDYLIESTAARHGSIRVAGAPGGARIDSADPALLASLAVDRALRPLGLRMREGALHTPLAPDAAVRALVDEGYPALAADGAGGALPQRGGAPDPAPGAPTPAHRYARLIRAVRAGTGADAEAAWLARALEQAVRSRSVVEVTVRMPDGGSRDFVLEATALSGGRLRGRDRAADVERTLPLSRIARARPV